MNERILLAGGSGFLGQSLNKHLTDLGYECIVLSRSSSDRPGHAYWDAQSVGDWKQHLEGATAIINLTGRSVDCRHNAANRREIIDSRVHSIQALAEAVRQCTDPPSTWIQSSSLAVYGDAGDAICDEKAPHGNDFSVGVCHQWEEELSRQNLPNMRTVFLRIGFALAANGGALGRLTSIVRLFLGGTVGNGRQYISWLHIDDMNHVFQWCLENADSRGAYNATCPNPVTNTAFMSALRRVLHRPWSPPAPAFAVRVGAFLMGTEASLALTGRRCIPQRLVEEGFVFKHTDLHESLRELFGA